MRRWTYASRSTGPVLTGMRVLGLASGGLVASAAFVFLRRASESIQVVSLRQTVLMLETIGCAAIMLLTAHYVEVWVAQFRSERGSTPFPRWLRFLLGVAIPTLAVSVPLLAVYGSLLGSVRRWLILAVFIVLEHWTFLIVRSVRAGQVSRLLGWGSLSVSALGGPLLVRADAAETRNLSRAQVVPDAMTLLQQLTDVDRDGFGSLFGGRDCYAFKRRRHPGARDIPDNGIDEDCDGRDASSSSPLVAVQPKYSTDPPLAGQRFNVVWYIVDSLRADHLKPYGYPYDTSPTLTALAREAWVFARAYSQSSTTTISIPSMFSGRNPSSLQYVNGGAPFLNEFYLPRHFSARGYVTGLTANAWIKDRITSLTYGFELVVGAPPAFDWGSGDYILLNLIDLVTQSKHLKKPVFAVAHVDDVHYPYTSSRGKAVPDFPLSGRAAPYDKGIALFDQNLRVFLEYLKHVGMWDQTVLIVTADHGEEFGEHGGAQHSRTCNREVTHVPLLIRVPGAAPQRIENPVALVDVAPTLLELIGDRTVLPQFDGQSLLIPVYEPGSVSPERPIYCTVPYIIDGRLRHFTRSVRCGDWAFTEEVLTGRVELYNQRTDPGETANLARLPAYSATIAELRGVLSATPEGNLLRALQAVQ